MDVTKPYEFIGFGAMDVIKPCEFTGFGARLGKHFSGRPGHIWIYPGIPGHIWARLARTKDMVRGRLGVPGLARVDLNRVSASLPSFSQEFPSIPGYAKVYSMLRNTASGP